MNLLKETLEVLKENGRSFDDVLFIQGSDFGITKEQFLTLADVEYYSSYGAAEVAEDLEIIGKDFLMCRAEYDGSEWWDFQSFIHPIKKKIRKINRLVVNEEEIGWMTLSELNKETEK